MYAPLGHALKWMALALSSSSGNHGGRHFQEDSEERCDKMAGGDPLPESGAALVANLPIDWELSTLTYRLT